MKKRKMKAGEAFVGMKRRGSQLFKERVMLARGFFDLTMLLLEWAGDREGGSLKTPVVCTCLLKQNIVDGDSADEARGVGLDLDGDACAVMTCNCLRMVRGLCGREGSVRFSAVDPGGCGVSGLGPGM